MTQVRRSTMKRTKGAPKEYGRIALMAVGAVVALMMIFNTLFSNSASSTLVPTVVNVVEEQPRENLRSKSGATEEQPPSKVEMTKEDVGEPPSKVEMTKEDVGDPIVQKGKEMKLSQDIFKPENGVRKDDPDSDGNTANTLKDHMIFHHYHKGKSGAVIEDMIMCHAYAFHQDAIYGGACGEPSTKMQSHQDLLDSIGLKDVLPFSCPNDHVQDENTRRSVIPRDNFRQDDTRIWTPEYVDYLRSFVKYPPKESDKYTIAVHIRRGDVTPCRIQNKGFDRYLPNSHFLELIEQYNKPDARVIIFSQGKSHESLDAFREKGYEVSLDDELKYIWRTFVTADVVMLSRSDFSMIPAIVAQGTVVYTPFWHAPLRRWKRVDKELMGKTDAETKRLQELCPKKNQAGGDTFH